MRIEDIGESGIDKRVSIRQLKAIHELTHPGAKIAPRAKAVDGHSDGEDDGKKGVE
ncbi:MAG: hypothetical protein IT175_01160 [Acidobacteria bacterium]|nr:hypothetical protein [Acidobacteriota bacterium]